MVVLYSLFALTWCPFCVVVWCGVVWCGVVWCVSSSNYQAPATYLIAVYGRTQARYTIVATAAAASVIEAEDGQTYRTRVVSNNPTQGACKYFQ